MPRDPSHQVPKYRRQAGGQGDHAFVVLNEHRHYLGPFDSTESRSECHRLVAEFLTGGGRLSVPTNQGTMAELLKAFSKNAEVRYRKYNDSPTAERANFESLLKMMNELCGDTLCDDFRGPAR